MTPEPAADPQVFLISFGYLHGAPPSGAHLIVDVRDHFRNPASDETLRYLDATSARVRARVLETPGAAELASQLALVAAAFLEGPVPGQVTIAVGCVGGRHRSAVIANTAGRILRQRDVPVRVIHRDMHRPVIDRPAGGAPGPAGGPVTELAEAMALRTGTGTAGEWATAIAASGCLNGREAT